MSTLTKLLTAFLVIMMTACGSGRVEVTSSFDNTKDIREGAPVYANDVVVGEISDVIEQENGVRVAIELDKEAMPLINARSAMVVNRLKMGAPLEIYSSGVTTETIQAGQEIEGLDSMFQLGAWMVGDAIQVGSGSVREYVGAFQQYLNSDQFQQDKALVSATVSEVADIASDSIKQVEDDISDALTGLSKSEQEMAAAVERLGEELAPVMQEMSKTGTKLAMELEEFSRRLETAGEAERESGQEFLDSLVLTLEKLNESMEKGAAEAQQDNE